MAKLGTGRRPLILDTTVLNNFLQAQCSHLLQQLPMPVCICPAVHQEIVQGMALGKVPEAPLDWLLVVSLQPEEMAQSERLRSRLGAGEAESIAVALSRGWRFATDDRVARHVAAQFQIPLTGTVGILAWCVKEGKVSIDQANFLLAQMITCGYRAPVSRLDEVSQEIEDGNGRIVAK